MSQNNVFQLFAANTRVKSKKDQESKTQPSSGEEPLLSKLSRLNLEANHPLMGLKYGGYMPLSCLVFVPELFHLLNPGQFKILMYLTFLKWRYPEKSGCVRAALSYLSQGVDISRSTVHENLIRLEALELIECVEMNLKLGNLYRVADLILWTPSKESKSPEQQQSEMQQSEFQQSEIRTATVHNSDCTSPKISTHQSEIQTEDLSLLSSSTLFYSLSEHVGFKARWNKLPAKTVKRERDAIHAILEKNPEDLNEINEIYDTLVEIETTGKAYDGQPCRSPIGLITSSWPAIKRIRATRKADSLRHNTPIVETSALKEQESFLQQVQFYVSSLKPSDIDALHNAVESEIRKARPNIGEIRKDTRIYVSFLETVVATRLGLEVPETN